MVNYEYTMVLILHNYFYNKTKYKHKWLLVYLLKLFVKWEFSKKGKKYTQLYSAQLNMILKFFNRKKITLLSDLAFRLDPETVRNRKVC